MHSSNNRRRVILVTDGDRIAQKAVETAAANIGGRCISASAGNPTPISGETIVDLVKKAKHDPVVVMFDDRGSCREGKGEKALKYVLTHPDLEVLGVLAVASNTDRTSGVEVDYAVTGNKEVIEGEVDKEGNRVSDKKMLRGDTVGVLNELRGRQVPLVIGVGDIGKMDGRDNPCDGAQITTKAFQTILNHWQEQA